MPSFPSVSSKAAVGDKSKCFQGKAPSAKDSESIKPVQPAKVADKARNNIRGIGGDVDDDGVLQHGFVHRFKRVSPIEHPGQIPEPDAR